MIKIPFYSNLAYLNFSKWCYTGSFGSKLSDLVIWGLNKQEASSSCSIAIPQIDWEHISDTEKWQEEDYDGAVLEVMGLKWNENKDGVVRK